MKVTFLGAAHEVTGSCTLIEAGDKKGLVDCGMEQGKDIFENQKLPVDPSQIDFVLLTHAHIDHSGNLPLLYKNGFRGAVYASSATCSGDAIKRPSPCERAIVCTSPVFTLASHGDLFDAIIVLAIHETCLPIVLKVNVGELSSRSRISPYGTSPSFISAWKPLQIPSISPSLFFSRS